MSALCAHCRTPLGAEACEDANGLDFCCPGCRGAYNLILSAGLLNVHETAQSAGERLFQVETIATDFSWVDDPSIRATLLRARLQDISVFELSLPTIHCAACILLLENLPRIQQSVQSARVNFGHQTLRLRLPQDQPLAPVLKTLSELGYPPDLSRSLGGKSLKKSHLKLYLGLSFFAFGNIMLLAFPEYLAQEIDPEIQRFLHVLQAFLSLISMYCAFRVFFPAIPRSLRSRQLDMDVPVSIGIVAMAAISYTQILQGQNGFFDSLSGLTFFLICGRAFQQNTWQHLNFEQDWKDFLPLAVTRIENEGDRIVPLATLSEGDCIRLLPSEVLPADATLLSESAEMNLSFITGEADLIHLKSGEEVLAGSRLETRKARFQLNKTPDSSYLASLWRAPAQKGEMQMQNSLSARFSAIILIIASLAFLYWLHAEGASKALYVLASVLVVACPCALALSVPLALAHGMRALSRLGFWLSDAAIVERMARCNTLVLDKTGTLTSAMGMHVEFAENSPSPLQADRLASLCSHSLHPISRGILKLLSRRGDQPVQDFQETPGVGLEARIQNQWVELKHDATLQTAEASRTVYYENHQPIATILSRTDLRDGVLDALRRWSHRWPLYLLTGDSQIPPSLKNLFADKAHIRVLPDEKRRFVESLEASGQRVLMVGDGMNDSGALISANTGLSIVEGSGKIFPSSDGMLDSDSLILLDKGMRLAKAHIGIAIASIVLSLIYNLLGLSFALMGKLEPVVCAILMPASSLSVAIVSIISSKVFTWLEMKSCRLCSC